MGSKSRGGGRGGQQAAPTYSYGGQSGMNQAAANAAYKADAANWRAPTTSAPMTAGMAPVSTTPSKAFGSDGGPALPGFGVPLAAPTMDVGRQRNTLARQMASAGPLGQGMGLAMGLFSGRRGKSMNMPSYLNPRAGGR